MAVMMETEMYSNHQRVGVAFQNVDMITNRPVDVLEAAVGGAGHFEEKNAVRRVASDTTRLERELHKKVSENDIRRVSFPLLAHAHLSTACAREASQSFWGMEMLYAREKRSSETSLQLRVSTKTLAAADDSTHSTDSSPLQSTDSLPLHSTDSLSPHSSDSLPLKRIPSPESRPMTLNQSPTSSPTNEKGTHALPPTPSTPPKKEGPRKRSVSLESRPVILNWSPTNEKGTDSSLPLPSNASLKEGPRERSCSLESRPVILKWSPTMLKSTNAKRSNGLHRRRALSLQKTSFFKF